MEEEQQLLHIAYHHTQEKASERQNSSPSRGSQSSCRLCPIRKGGWNEARVDEVDVCNDSISENHSSIILEILEFFIFTWSFSSSILIVICHCIVLLCNPILSMNNHYSSIFVLSPFILTHHLFVDWQKGREVEMKYEEI